MVPLGAFPPWAIIAVESVLVGLGVALPSEAEFGEDTKPADSPEGLGVPLPIIIPKPTIPAIKSKKIRLFMLILIVGSS